MLTPERETIKVAHIRNTCPACPSQWEGATDDGQYVYIRYRWGWLRVEVGNEIVYHQRIGGQLDGHMDENELSGHLKGVLDFTGIRD